MKEDPYEIEFSDRKVRHDPPDVRSLHRRIADQVAQYVLTSNLHQGYRREYRFTKHMIAQRLSIRVCDAGRAISDLVRVGILLGPIEAEKDEKHYALGSTVEWDGENWVFARQTGWIHETLLKKYGRKTATKYYRSPSKITRKLERKAKRPPSGWDGLYYEVAPESPASLEAAERLGVGKKEDEPRGTKRQGPSICPRCRQPVRFRSVHGKRRADHSIRKCNFGVVKHIMET